MQTAESVCLWNYQFKNGSPPSPNSTTQSNKKCSIDLTCTERLACQNEMSSKASIFCLQCNSLQCYSCDKDIHENIDSEQHERLNLDEIDDEFCSIDRRHSAVFFCPTCSSMFCYSCYENQHQHSDGREHKPQKFRTGQQTKPIKIQSSSSKPSPSSFEDVHIDEQQPTNKRSHQTPKRHNFNQQMLLESMLDDGTQDSPFSNSQQVHSDLDKGFLLLDNNERLTVNETEFLRRLQAEQDLNVKTVSILGNTGDGKSYTLNQIFFNGQEVFHTSPTAESCTMGVWAALDDNHRTLVLDTEGRLGLTENDNQRNRLLLKILCISDVVIYRTRASKLPNDMFQFLSDASNAFLKYFRKELENVMKNCKADGPMSTMGPTLVIFHETQHTGVLKGSNFDFFFENQHSRLHF